MTKNIFTLLVFVVPFIGAAQTTLTEGAKKLFANTKSKLTTAEKNDIYKKTGFLLSADKKQFIQDKDAADFPFDAFVFTTDLNKDGKEEVFVQFGNSFTSGHTGSSVLLYIKNKAGKYESNLGFPGVELEALATASQGYPDLLIGVPGFEFPVWRWNGKEYDYHRKVKDVDLSKLKRTSISDISKAYSKTIQ